jgi:alpha-glucosidase
MMNFNAFMDPLTYFLTGLEKHSEDYRADLFQDGEAFFTSILDASCDYPWASLLAAMNELSNHDHARFLTRTKRTVGRLHTMGAEAASSGVDKAVLREAVAAQMTWVGAPTIYYGDEAGLAGWTDPDCRRCFPWDAMDDELVGYHRALAEVRRAHPAIRSGALVRLGCGHGWIAFARLLGEDRVCTFVNNTDGPLAVTCRVWVRHGGRGRAPRPRRERQGRPRP